MMSYTKKYIITGAPGTGKTTLISMLESSYPCMHEISRSVIINEQETGGNGMPWQNLKRFVALVFEKTIHPLQNDHESVFHDRGLPDLIAYLKLRQLEIPSYLADFPFHNYYQSTVFYAPIWEEIYVTDAQRPTTLAGAKELAAGLLATYETLGFMLVKLPFASPSQRAEFIISAIRNN